MDADTDWGPDNPLRQFVKCAIVSIYMYYLIEINCGDTTGVNYALKAMSQIERDLRHAGTPANECLWERHDHTKIGEKNVNATVKTWLKGNATMCKRIQDLEKKTNCTQGNATHTTGKGVLAEKEIKDKIMDKMQQVQQEVQATKAGKGHIGTDNVNARNSINSQYPAQTPPEPPPGKDSVDAQPEATATPGTTPPHGSIVPVARSEEPAEPPSTPSSPPSAGTGQTQPGGTGNGTTQTTPEPAEGTTGKDSRQGPIPATTSTCGTTTDTETKEVNGNTATITITTVESSSPECSGSGTPGTEAGDSKTTTESQKPSEPPAVTKPTSGDPPAAPQVEAEAATGAPAAPAPTPLAIDSTTGNSGDQNTSTTPPDSDSPGPDSPPSSPDGKTEHTKDPQTVDPAVSSTEGAQGAPSSGTASNDDPPPLNSPKPKPNPNSDEAGSGTNGAGGTQIPGSAPSAGTEGGAGGQTGAGAGGGGGSSSSGTEQGTVGSTTTTDTQTPSTTVTPISAQSPLVPSAPKGGNGAVSDFVPPPSKPFDPKDLIPYTPAIIPAVVGIGLIAFFLWKYFAHLAKRRRKFRTVRDVPSPPLDEDILDHLQRGELPPLDYGYTMIRDSQPASISARRRRQPRVHKRTIIELHLEVLNECEVTEWQNVKDDYLQIVVQAFAQDLLRDDDTNNSILGVSTSDQGPPGTHVSSTVDQSTDIERTDASARNAEHPDPWRCMETIQLQTDPCRPNEDNHDPWSCMENIELERDRCPPNEEDPDPWSCMETIPLQTDPCRPHDPDPCSCMQSILLATDPCPPHEQDLNPCSCMETIPLQTDRSASDADDPDPWSCMENIQFAPDRSPPNEEDRWSCMERV
ncbi:hypothetical protein AK88_05045 [Plasmodium fragile]|uniref:Schizont-infected cell agglutination C-terminal domain-containing protein n=1 Tax=Plasmodium fragile TaxID=5857 RepID=A0A0D9QHZ4_PLAFR|nr:uncharacterized protein AK88_05045 [Plasmodium fragile]KJP85341.1 hypothetical protein AK88_05045 [Plasmodium fragile]